MDEVYEKKVELWIENMKKYPEKRKEISNMMLGIQKEFESNDDYVRHYSK